MEAEVNVDSSMFVPNCDDMIESDANPPTGGISSEDSTSLDKELEVNIGPALEAEPQDIFKAAQHFSRKDREEAFEERKKNSLLLDFISTHGLSMQDVNAYATEGKLAQLVSAQKLSASGLVPIAAGPSSVLREKQSFFGGSLTQVACVGEELTSERADPPPPLSPSKFGFLPGHTSKPFSNSNLNCISPAEEGKILVELCGSPKAMPPKSWCDVMAKNVGLASRSLSFHPPSVEDGNILVKPPVEVLNRGNMIWSSSLVGYFLHSSLPSKVVEPIARKLWGSMGLSKVFLYSKGYYIFKFNSTIDRDKVLASGPWHFTSKIMVLQKWQGVEFSKS